MSGRGSIWLAIHDTAHSLEWVDADAVRTRCLIAGDDDAPPLLLLHGTAGSLENFACNISVLSRHFRVVALDMLGCGLTDKPAFDYAITDYAAHVAAAPDAPDMFLKNARAIAATAPNAHRVDIPGCDHWAQFEQPDAFHRAVMPFLGIAEQSNT